MCVLPVLVYFTQGELLMQQDPSVSCTGPCPIVEGDHHHHQLLQVWAVLGGLAAQGRHPTHHLLADGTPSTHQQVCTHHYAEQQYHSSVSNGPVEELLPLVSLSELECIVIHSIITIIMMMMINY